MISASAAASSRALLAGSCRRGCRLPRVAVVRAEHGSDPGISRISGFDGGGCQRRPNSSHHSAFSTISFDAGALFGSNYATSSPESVDRSASFNVSPARSKTVSAQPSSHKQFQQQIEQWMASNPRIAPYKAEESLAKLWVEQQELFRQWEQASNSSAAGAAVSLPTILLTTDTVNLVLHAWCHSDNGEVAAKRAERLLHWMEDLQYEDSSQMSWSPFLPKPSYQSYATAIDAWSRAAVCESAHPSREPRTETGTSKRVSQATKVGFECARRAEDLLMHMQQMHEQQRMLAEESGSLGQYTSEIQPDTRVFNLVLKAWSQIRGGTKASALRAVRILDFMQELHHYQSMHAPEWQGVAMSTVQPNLQTYKMVLGAWANASHTVEGPDRAEEILRHMLSLSKAGNLGAEITPDAECFHIVMKAHAESVRKKRKGDDGSASVERARKVTELLDWMELLPLRRSTAKIRPTSESYRIALSAWVWSHHVNAPREAEAVLHRMIQACEMNRQKKPDSSLVLPETRDFNTLINCCSFARKVGADKSEEDDESLLQRQLEHGEIYDIAEGALQSLRSLPYVRPDSATFAGMIRACINLLPDTDERDRRAISLFRLAYQTPPAAAPSAKITSTSSERMRAPPGAGCVDANVLRQLRHALPSTEDYIRVREEFEEHRRKNAGEE